MAGVVHLNVPTRLASFRVRLVALGIAALEDVQLRIVYRWVCGVVERSVPAAQVLRASCSERKASMLIHVLSAYRTQADSQRRGSLATELAMKHKDRLPRVSRGISLSALARGWHLLRGSVQGVIPRPE